MPTDPKETRFPEYPPEIPQPPAHEPKKEPGGTEALELKAERDAAPLPPAEEPLTGAPKPPFFGPSEALPGQEGGERSDSATLSEDGARLSEREARAAVLAEARDTILTDSEALRAQDALIKALEARGRTRETN